MPYNLSFSICFLACSSSIANSISIWFNVYNSLSFVAIFCGNALIASPYIFTAAAGGGDGGNAGAASTNDPTPTPTPKGAPTGPTEPTTAATDVLPLTPPETVPEIAPSGNTTPPLTPLVASR